MAYNPKETIKHHIVLHVAPSGGRAGELQRFEYVEGDKFLTRKAALRHAETARMRWQDNYPQFRDATFAITDTAEAANVKFETQKKILAEAFSRKLSHDIDMSYLYNFVARRLGESEMK